MSVLDGISLQIGFFIGDMIIAVASVVVVISGLLGFFKFLEWTGKKRRKKLKISDKECLQRAEELLFGITSTAFDLDFNCKICGKNINEEHLSCCDIGKAQSFLTERKVESN